jgi:hypothetical protein
MIMLREAKGRMRDAGMLIVFAVLIIPAIALAGVDSEWGGHIRGQGSVSWPDDDSVFQLVGTGDYTDGSAELRLKNKTFFGDWAYAEAHYEAVLSGGDTRRKVSALEQIYPAFSRYFSGTEMTDDTRLMDLTGTIDDGDHYILYHRLDRLSLTLLPKWGTVRLGRQALTWGNGMLFNPMDLFNPFSPTDISRDYKVGDDMAWVQFAVENIGDFQFLYVPRRDAVSRDLEWDSSSIAGKLHITAGTAEFDIMAARHYKDYVAGLGAMGYLRDAAWRLDATWTFLDQDSDSDGFLSLVANMDYSWVWREKNFYGFAEFYYNGLGEKNYASAVANPDVSSRLARGEMFTLGKTYLSGEFHTELHPLFNVYLTVISNLRDPSGILQPRAVWDVAQNIQCMFGANLYCGRKGSEFGGFDIPGTNFVHKSPNSVFLWLTWYF